MAAVELDDRLVTMIDELVAIAESLTGERSTRAAFITEHCAEALETYMNLLPGHPVAERWAGVLRELLGD